MKNFLLVSPTIRLLEEQKKLLDANGVENQVITHETRTEGAVRGLVDTLKFAPRGGTVVLTTHAAYLRLPYFHQQQRWRVFIDEVPQVDEFHSLRLPRSKFLFLEHVEPDPSFQNENLVRLAPRDRKALDRYLQRPRDDCEEVLRAVLMDILSEAKDVYCTHEQWARLQPDCAEPDSQGRLNILSMLNGKAFCNVTLMGACVENSLLYHYLARRGHEFSSSPLVSGLRYQEYDRSLGERLLIDYLPGNRSYSKTLRDKELSSGLTVGDHAEFILLDQLRTEDFLYVTNNDYHGPLNELDGAVRLPSISHGLNDYQEHTTLVFLAALNRRPEHMTMLKALGLDADIVRRATAHEVLHQCVMRTNLRDPNSTLPVRVVVPDRFCADFLVKIFGSAETRALGDLDYEIKKPFTTRDRKRRSALKKSFRERMDGQDTVRNLMTPKGNCSESRSGQNQSPPPPANHPMLMLTLMDTKFGKKIEDFQTITTDPLELRKAFKKYAGTPLRKKDETYLFLLAEFHNPVRGEGFRTQKNLRSAFGVILDFDGGDLSPEEFERQLWHDCRKSQRRSFIICNSFSRSPENPNKFRVVIPFRQPAASLEIFQAAYDAIVRRIEAWGYTAESAKLDRMCRTGVQPFYLPCTNHQFPEMAFYRAYGLDRLRDFARFALDPVELYRDRPHNMQRLRLRTVKTMGDEIQPPFEGSSRDFDTLVAKISERRQKIQGMTEGRHSEFYQYACLLWRKGLTSKEIEADLEEVAGGELKLIKKIPGVMNSIAKKIEGHYRTSTSGDPTSCLVPTTYSLGSSAATSNACLMEYCSGANSGN